MEVSKYTLLECNRLRAGINENDDTYKNKWSNNINSSGIVVKKGDIITLESAAINTIGSTTQTMEFSGDVNENGYIDNKVSMDFSYYVNNSGKNLIPLPLKDHKAFLTYGTNPNHDYLLNRGLGEPEFIGTPDSASPYLSSTQKPYFGLIGRCELSNFSDSLTGSGYLINEIYKAVPLQDRNDPANPGYDPGSDFGYRVKIVDVVSEGTTAGIPSKIEVVSVGNYYLSPLHESALIPANYRYPNLLKQRLRLTVPVNPDRPNPTTEQDLEATLVSPAFYTRQTAQPDGKRYYYSNKDYTGSCQINIPDTPVSGFQPQMDKRITTVNLETPIGLSTPETIGTVLTEQLTKPSRLNGNFEQSEFLSGNGLKIEIGDDVSSTVLIPNIVDTPLYKAMPCNTCNARKTDTGNLSGIYEDRKTYYSNVVYSNPDRIIGLQHSRQFNYGLNNNLGTNEIHSGINEYPNRGDFNGYNGINGQTIGNLGLNQCLLMDFPSLNNIVVEEKGVWAVSNTYFTKDTVAKIAQGFRRAEKYYGDSGDLINNDIYTTEQIKNLGVALDLGLYDDEQSNGRKAINGSVYTNRRRFNCWLELYEGTRTTRNSPVAHNNIPCKGTIPFANFNYEEQASRQGNDGQQLSSMVVSSRWDDTYDYRNKNSNVFQRTFLQLRNQTSNLNQFSIPSSQTEEETFVKNYTDTTLGNLTYDELIGYSKEYDVACIPIFPAPGNDWYKSNGRPLLAYRLHLPLGAGNYDNKINGTYINWQIDKFNCPYGIQMGLDTSFVRNEAAFVYNLNYAITKDNNDDIVEAANARTTYPEYIMSGASNPSFNFDTTLSRFELTGLNTPITIGNGQLSGSQRSLIPEEDPEEIVANISEIGTISRVFIQPDPTLTTTNIAPYPPEDAWVALTEEGSFADIRQTSTSIIDSLTGVSIEGITLTKNDGTTTSIKYYQDYSNDIFRNTILGKLGFTPAQLLPRTGYSNGLFNNKQSYLQQGTSYYDILTNVPQPLTTGSYFSSPEYQASTTNSIGLPMYGISGSTGLPSRPSVVPSSITAFKLPQKLEYPYLNVYSSIVSNGTNTTYYGGGDGKSKINCVGYITRFNNEGDFFYQIVSNYSFTSLKDFVLTDIDTDIRLPDGSRPRLEPHSSIIYKIQSTDIIPQE